MAAVVEELQELLLTWDKELMQREEALAMREEKAGIMDKALAKVSADLDTERTKAEATWKKYLNKMVAHTTRAKHSLGLDKMLGEKKVELDWRKRDLERREAVLAEAQTRGFNPQENPDGLMEFVELWRFLQDVAADCVIEAGWLATLVRDVSKVLADLGVPPIPEIPQDSCTADSILEAVDIILEHLLEAYASGHGHWD
jgi:hypothetical protein